MARLERIVSVDNEQQIRSLTYEKAAQEERAKVLEVMLASCRDDFGAKIPRQSKELLDLITHLQVDAKTHADELLSKDNSILELKFDKEELKRAISRLHARIADLELLAQLNNNSSNQMSKGSALPKGKETELQSVVTALQTVVEKLQTENESLKKTAVPNTKYMEVCI